jgi:hypothetical protein
MFSKNVKFWWVLFLMLGANLLVIDVAFSNQPKNGKTCLKDDIPRAVDVQVSWNSKKNEMKCRFKFKKLESPVCPKNWRLMVKLGEDVCGNRRGELRPPNCILGMGVLLKNVGPNKKDMCSTVNYKTKKFKCPLKASSVFRQKNLKCKVKRGYVMWKPVP